MSSTSNPCSVCVRTTSHVDSIAADQISYYIIFFHETFVFNHFQWCLPRNGSSSTWTVSMIFGKFSGVRFSNLRYVWRLMWLLLRYPFVIRRQFALPLPFVTALEPGVLVGGWPWDFEKRWEWVYQAMIFRYLHQELPGLFHPLSILDLFNDSR